MQKGYYYIRLAPKESLWMDTYDGELYQPTDKRKVSWKFDNHEEATRHLNRVKKQFPLAHIERA